MGLANSKRSQSLTKIGKDHQGTVKFALGGAASQLRSFAELTVLHCPTNRAPDFELVLSLIGGLKADIM